MAKIMVVVGHPQDGSLCAGLAGAYAEGARSRGHEAEVFHLAQMKFDPILHEGYLREQPLEPDLKHAYRVLSGCDHLVLVFPLWCGDMPALLKGFIERVLQPDLIARENTDSAMNWRIFRDKSARIVMTMGMPALVYRFWYRPHALKLLARNILKFIGITPVRHTLYGMARSVSVDKRAQWLNEMRALGRAAG